MAIEGARPVTRQVSPHLIVDDVDAAATFYKAAFGAVELYRGTMPNGLVMHAQLRVFDSTVLLTFAGMPGGDGGKMQSPKTLGGSSTMLEIYVDECDAAYRKAIEAGGTPWLEPCDQFYGDRYGILIDPFGHVWALATPKEMLSPMELQQRMEAMFRNPPACPEPV